VHYKGFYLFIYLLTYLQNQLLWAVYRCLFQTSMVVVFGQELAKLDDIRLICHKYGEVFF